MISHICVSCPQVNIQIDQGTDPMRITVAGQPHTVDTAATAVAEIINGGNPFGAGGPASLGGAPRLLSYFIVSHTPLATRSNLL